MGRGGKSSVHARVLVLHLPPCKSSSHVILDVKILAAEVFEKNHSRNSISIMQMLSLLCIFCCLKLHTKEHLT
jgi:hypothetical protein